MWIFTSSIWCRDSNSQPSDYKSPPLTTRPGLPPTIVYCLKRPKIKEKEAKVGDSVTRLGDLLDFGQLFKA